MCGRFVLVAAPDAIQQQFSLPDMPELSPRYNIAPTQTVAVITNENPRELSFYRWGLIPSWSKDASIGSRMINARSEGVEEKPAFRAAFKRRRCLVPASGFYEWRKLPNGKKQPYLIRRRDGAPMSFTGLWEEWKNRATDEVITSCTIITCGPNAVMAELHDRMPVILAAEDIDRWLAMGGDDLLRPCPDDWLEAYPVSTRVNSVRNDDPGLVDPVEEPDLFE